MNKTDLRFGEGITTVVGPNGCGKTNIVDAIRWILGEHKNSLLRSTRMEDVIFNGTKTQKPLGFCEVSLSIHNNRGVLPVEYVDIEVTRRLFRSGDSEYLLNKVPCRLKDINDLFVNTGMGAHAYSVIELNMIDTLLSYNPEGRQKLFEEAAGVSHYKQQRNSTYRQLESTLSDLERVNDIIVEVQDKVNHLKLQLKRFDRHKTLIADLRKSEIYLSQIQIQTLEEEIHPVITKLRTLKSKFSSITGQLTLDETLIENEQKKHEAQKILFNEASQKTAEIERNLRGINDNILIWTEKIKANESRLLQFGDEMKVIDGRNQTLSDQLGEIQTKIHDIQPEISKSDRAYAEKNAILNQMTDKLRIKNAEFHSLKTEIENVSKLFYKNEARLTQIKKSIEEKNNAIDELMVKKTALIDQSGNLDFNLTEINSRISNQEKLNITASISLEELQNEQSASESELMSLREKRLLIQSQVKDEQSRLQFYREIIQKYEGQSNGAKYVLTRQSDYKGVLGPVIDLVDTEDKYRRAIESGLDESTHYLVVDTYQNAKNIISDFQSKQDLSIYLIPLDLVPANPPNTSQEMNGIFADSVISCDERYKNLFTFLLKNKIIVDSKTEIREKISDRRFDYLTLEGDQFKSNGLIKIISKKNVASIGRKQQIESIEKEILSLDALNEQIIADISHREQAAFRLRNSIKIKSRELDDGIKIYHNLESKRSEIMYKQKHSQSVLSTFNSEATELKTRITQLTLEHEEVRSEGEDTKRYVDTKNQELRLFESEINDIRISHNRIQQDVQDARVKLIETKKELEGLEFRSKSCKDQISELEARKQYIYAEQEKSRLLIQNLTDELLTANDTKLKMSQLQEDQLKEKSKIESDYNTSFVGLQDVQRIVRDQQKIKEKSMLQIQNYEMQIVDATKEIEIIRRRIRDVYRCEIPIEKFNLNEIDQNDISSSIESINRSIEKIGPINMEVKDEFETESNRLGFLTKQIKDLTDSEQTLRGTINRIDDEVRTQFLNTFEEIRNNFKITYSKFFKGGEADIKIVGEDPLESDISIVARPPGKRTQTLRMLSAGEKSLTAIALLFAIYLVKPSPFCILDEVDAPLDDINIRKFTKVLGEFSDKTQFIVVTHNKLTMEASDYLYGITQEEEGVSKVVSVKFKDEPSRKTSDIVMN